MALSAMASLLLMSKYFLVLCLVVVILPQAMWASEGSERYTNRLINSQDPYLLLHAHNPVDWYPWGPEALEKARRENKPIFISVGYSTCYWCHVAEREIYSNPQIAKLMNEWFVNIKIDREERPDLDRIYMRATQVLTGRGGWPNNVFMTPDLKPFFAGSYFPPKSRGKRPGFPQILTRIHKEWVEDHEQVMAKAETVYQRLQQAELSIAGATASLPGAQNWLERAVLQAAGTFDDLEGGFGTRGTKFPKSPLLSMLLAAYTQAQWGNAAQMSILTLEAMAAGGIMDHLAGGFHRYSTEPGWSIPHFEKMLYDNTQLLGLYARTYEITDSEVMRQATLRTAHYLRTEMQAPAGGFYSAQDAEVDGIEGASYCWTRGEIESVLGVDDSGSFFQLYKLAPMPDAPYGHQQPEGGVLRFKQDTAVDPANDEKLAATIKALKPARDKLLAVRQERKQPARDEKIVIADNALAIISFAQAGKALREPELSKVATKTADWIWKNAFDSKTGELKHLVFKGQPGGQGFLDDYALFGQALMMLYHETENKRWRSRAQRVADAMLERFARPDGALSSSWDTTDLLVVPPEQGDSVKPSGQSAAIALLLDLSISTNRQVYATAAYRALLPLYPGVNAYPSGWGTLLTALSEPGAFAALEAAVKTDAVATRIDRLPDSSDYVHARGYWAASQEGSELIVTIKVETGYHINANPASEPLLVPTQVLLAGHPAVKMDFPQAQIFKAPFAPEGIDVYEGRITLKTRLPMVQALNRPLVSLKIQACNDEVCLAPATIAVPVSSKK